MADQSEKEPTPAPTAMAQVVRSDFFRIIYANIVRCRMSVYDLAITFGVYTDSPGASTANLAIEETQIVLAHAQAKYLRDTLDGLLNAFEKEIGPIPTPNLTAAVESFVPNAIAALKPAFTK